VNFVSSVNCSDRKRAWHPLDVSLYFSALSYQGQSQSDSGRMY
jgi:hypothetical protein